MQARLSLEDGTAIPVGYTFAADETVSLGRGLENTIVLNDKCASKQHASIFAVEDRWFIRDLDSHNGVVVNGRRVRGDTELPHGALIILGDVHFRFAVAAGDDFPAANVPAPREPDGRADNDETVLRSDELTALYHFLSASLHESGPQGLARLALETLLRQTQADLTGFRSIGADELVVVLPEQGRVDARLSSRLTEKALKDGLTAWMADPGVADMSGESLAGFCDALCVPLLEHPNAAGKNNEPLGALHVYRLKQAFTQREARFCEVLAGCLAGCLRGVRDRRALEADNSRLRLGSPSGDDTLIGDSAAVRSLRDQIVRLADYPGTVLITGETGVGKELVALGLHRASRRRDGPLVTVNCASLSPNMAVAELFGHDDRAFTGAGGAHAGFFQQAEGGALFLDEIGELTPETQGMLLRALESRCIRPLMGKKDVKIDVRVLAATNRNLEREVQTGRFRKDLFYRLTVPIKAPPLRDHVEDVPALARHFLANLQRSDPRPLALTDAALERLRTYSWPGNVRQLRYLLEGAAALSRDGKIDAADLHLTPGSAEPTDAIPLNLEALEAWAIRRALAQTDGANARAAKVLGIHRDTLIAKIKKYGIDRRPEDAK
jgi:two-component system, NtrC family, response regulator HydG